MAEGQRQRKTTSTTNVAALVERPERPTLRIRSIIFGGSKVTKESSGTPAVGYIKTSAALRSPCRTRASQDPHSSDSIDRYTGKVLIACRGFVVTGLIGSSRRYAACPLSRPPPGFSLTSAFNLRPDHHTPIHVPSAFCSIIFPVPVDPPLPTPTTATSHSPPVLHKPPASSKNAHHRSSRPAQLTRRQTPREAHKRKTDRKKVEEGQEFEEADSMTSFLQYWYVPSRSFDTRLMGLLTVPRVRNKLPYQMPRFSTAPKGIRHFSFPL